jgi:pentatricopeptide repeat protein
MLANVSILTTFLDTLKYFGVTVVRKDQIGRHASLYCRSVDREINPSMVMMMTTTTMILVRCVVRRRMRATTPTTTKTCHQQLQQRLRCLHRSGEVIEPNSVVRDFFPVVNQTTSSTSFPFHTTTTAPCIQQHRRFSSSSSQSSLDGVSHIDHHNQKLNTTSTWEERVESFLRVTSADKGTSTYDSSSSSGDTATSDLFDTTIDDRNTNSSKTLLKLQALIDEMLTITSEMAMKRKPKNRGTDFVVVANDEETSPTTSWNILNAFRMKSPPPPSSSNDFSDETTYDTDGSLKNIPYSIPSSLAFALLDRLVQLENIPMGDGSYHTSHSFMNDHSFSWTVNLNCLNPVLALWRDEYTNSVRRNQSVSRNMIDGQSNHLFLPSLLTPHDVISKLDRYRKQSNILLPDTISYNIVLDAVAEKKMHSKNSKTSEKNRSADGDGDDDVYNAEDFCLRIWRWLLEESKHDPMIRPDVITLKAIFKSYMSSGRPDAPQQCERLVEEWVRWKDAGDQHPGWTSARMSTSYTSVMESLVHVWAHYDPENAERYIHEIARRFLSVKDSNIPLSECSEPPGTVTWNRVISSYAIIHDDPSSAQKVLKDFLDFHWQANQQGDGETLHPYAWKVGRPDLWSYNALLEGYARQKNALEANKLFARLQQVQIISPNIQSYTSVMKANEDDLATVNSLAHQCMEVYKQQQMNGESDDKKLLDIDGAFFDVWLIACAKAQSIEQAKKIFSSHLRSIPGVQPQTSTFLCLLEVFLSKSDSQGAIEWLLAYAKLENMGEPAIVAWTLRLIHWYKEKNKIANGETKENVDLTIMLQILVENQFIKTTTSFERLLMRLSPYESQEFFMFIQQRNRSEANALLTPKMYAIVMHSLAETKYGASAVENLFDIFNEMCTTTHENEQDVDSLRINMYTSLIVAWAKQENLDRIMYWIDRMVDEYGGEVPPLDIAAQVAVASTLCGAGKVSEAEDFVVSMRKAYEEGTPNAVPPDTALYNAVLKGWLQQENGEYALSFLEREIPRPDAVSYNCVINALCQEGKLDDAEALATRVVELYGSKPSPSLRPDDYTFTPILAGWRRDGHLPGAAKRAERILNVMIDLHRRGVMVRGPCAKSYQVVFDTWEKSNDPHAATHCYQLLQKAPDHIRKSKGLKKKVRWIRRQSMEGNSRPG